MRHGGKTAAWYHATYYMTAEWKQLSGAVTRTRGCPSLATDLGSLTLMVDPLTPHGRQPGISMSTTIRLEGSSRTK